MEESLLKDGVSSGVTTIIGSSGNSHLPAQGENLNFNPNMVILMLL